MRIVCQQTIPCTIMPYLLFFEKQHNLKLSSAANYRWSYNNKGPSTVFMSDCSQNKVDSNALAYVTRRLIG